MEHTSNSGGKPYIGRPSQQLIFEMIGEYEASEFSVEEYCEYKGLNPDTFQGWLTKYKNKNELPTFVPVAVKDDDAPSESLFAEYRGLKFYKPMDASFFKALIS